MSQTKASDQWSFYQSKSIKSYIFGMQANNLEMQRDMLSRDDMAKSSVPEFDDKIAEYRKKVEQYEQEMDKISAEATDYEREKDNCKTHANAFVIAVIFLQISILLSSIAALTNIKYVWYLSLAVGLAGIFYFFDGFFLFLK